MKIKKFLAPTLREASEKMKLEFGDEAIILGTRVVNKQLESGSVKLFEITSGIEEESDRFAKEDHGLNDDSDKKELDFTAELSRISENIGKRKNHSSLMNILDTAKIKSFKKNTKLTKELLNTAIENLLHKEVDKPIVKTIVSQLKKSQNLITDSNLENYIISTIASLVSTSHFEIERKGKPKVVALVGPTGVGKTTCIAKLAAISKILHNLNIGIISVDTYRLGAIDQLRIFSDISNIDMLVAYEPQEMPGLIKQLKNKDIIFIDTAGRSQNNRKDMEKTKEFLDNVNVNETYLVLSSTSSSKNLIDTAEKFKFYNYDSLIFTKIDESVSFGNILNVMVEVNSPIIYLTNGQVIPDDIISADSEFIANMIYTGKVLA
ncbi:MAG: flagellar biosynthesis protein FlhF [Melioribacteraceae bacterium]|nr:flagellar biosynthesis protein FlhF [Melioribacteraceae bacterium]